MLYYLTPLVSNLESDIFHINRKSMNVLSKSKIFSWFYLVPLPSLDKWNLSCLFCWQKLSHNLLGIAGGVVLFTDWTIFPFLSSLWTATKKIMIFTWHAHFSLEMRDVGTTWPVYKYPFWSRRITLKFIMCSVLLSAKMDFRETHCEVWRLNEIFLCKVSLFLSTKW